MLCWVTEQEICGIMYVRFYKSTTDLKPLLAIGERVIDVFVWYDKTKGQLIRVDKTEDAASYTCNCLEKGYPNCLQCPLKVAFQEC
eukprot:2848211-Rhodomonas_salina.2